MASDEKKTETSDALQRVQRFDANSIARVADLGKQLNFAEAVAPAQLVIEIYKRIPLTIVDDLTDSMLDGILSQARADFQIFSEMLSFDATRSDAVQHRKSLISQVEQRRDAAFQQLWQYIAYGVARLTDTALLETQARSTIQGIKDQAKALTDQLSADKISATSALDAIRAAAAEQGVSQQASYFKGEAEDQEEKAAQWLRRTYQFSAALGAFALVSLFLHRWEWLAPKSLGETAQFVTSKILIFTVLGYLLLLAARNFATHKHNAVVNRHRQNALLTYRALVEAASERGSEDIVLAHAAACIFAPQETGFSAGRAEGSSGPKSVLELLTKTSPKVGE